MTKTEKFAFTLTEVLITIGVIGVVAALTLPTLINEHRISQWETALKRDYTVLSQGFRKIMADYGCDTIECTGIFTTTTDEEGNEVGDHDKLDEAMRSVFHVVKSYKHGEGEDREIKYLKGVAPTTGQSYDILTNQRYRMVLNDGAIVYFSPVIIACTPYGPTKSCSFLYIDLNGLLPPNTQGKDVHALGRLLNDGTLVPDSSRQYEEYTSSTKSYWRNGYKWCGKPDTKLKDDPTEYINGQNCLARIMENNWRMDYLH